MKRQEKGRVKNEVEVTGHNALRLGVAVGRAAAWLVQPATDRSLN